MWDTSLETKKTKKSISFLFPNTVVTRRYYVENTTYATHTVITTRLPEATDDPT